MVVVYRSFVKFNIKLKMNITVKQIKSKLLDSGSLTSHFILSNLSKGLALTLGNSLRRLLLSNLTGTAIIAIKIPGVFSEFSSILGIREDVLEIILNLKEVILRSQSGQIHYGFIKIQGPGVLTAKCICFSSAVQIINPNLYIATIYNKQLFQCEVIAQRSKGYAFIPTSKSYYPLFLPIDAIFMPVLAVNYTIKVQNQLEGNFMESLLLEITTNGSLSPNAALLYSVTFFSNIFTYIKHARSTLILPK